MPGDGPRERLRLGERLARGNHAVDEAEALDLGGAVEPAGQRHLHRVLARHRAADRNQRRRTEEAHY